MSPSVHMGGPPSAYATATDILRPGQDYRVTKNRRMASTGGGRAWSEEEEQYLLQTRLQKMPYKHIAAHLKKTELACRLHYHQLSHGSNRRVNNNNTTGLVNPSKPRTLSVSSGSSAGYRSPVLAPTAPMLDYDRASARSPTPPGSSSSAVSAASSYTLTPTRSLQLPSLMPSAVHGSSPPRLLALLPKPTSVAALPPLAPAANIAARASPSPTPSARTVMYPRGSPLRSLAGGSGSGYRNPLPGQPLRLDCSSLPPLIPRGQPLSSGNSAQQQQQQQQQQSQHMATMPHGLPSMASHPVDMGRLSTVYNTHRASFWATVAADYGQGADAVVLERAWNSGGSSSSANATSTSGMASTTATSTPITPVASPDERPVYLHGYGYPPMNEKPTTTTTTTTTTTAATNSVPTNDRPFKSDKTRISAILGINADPRSPGDREMVRRLEEHRYEVVSA